MKTFNNTLFSVMGACIVTIVFIVGVIQLYEWLCMLQGTYDTARFHELAPIVGSFISFFGLLIVLPGSFVYFYYKKK